MRQRSGYLEPTVSQTRPTSVIFLACQSEPYTQVGKAHRHHLVEGLAVHLRTRRGERLRHQSALRFTDPREFWSWLDSRARARTATYLVGAGIERSLLLTRFQEHALDLGFAIRPPWLQGNTRIIRLQDDRRRVTCLDIRNWYPLDLRDLAVEFERHGPGERSGPGPPLDVGQDLEREVSLVMDLFKLWLDFLDEHDLGAFKVTAASTAFNAFRYRFLDHYIHIHNNKLALDLERRAYHGGRAEHYWEGEQWGERFANVDYNSMYGTMLELYDYPTRLRHVIDNPSIALTERRLKTQVIIADVTLHTEEPMFPYETDRRVIYPFGVFRTTLTTAGIELALEHNALLEVHRLAVYRKDPIFQAYAEYFHHQRLRYEREGDRPRTLICKLMINSLYGKFGQSRIDIEEVGTCDPEEIMVMPVYRGSCRKVWTEVHLGGKIWNVYRQGESLYSCPSIAAHVTGYGRRWLWWAMREVPEKHLYRVHTDSLLVDEVGLSYLDGLLNEKEPGLLKIETSGSYLKLVDVGLYTIGNKVKSSGLSRYAQPLPGGGYRDRQIDHITGMLARGKFTDYTERVIETRQGARVSSAPPPPGRWLPLMLVEGTGTFRSVPRGQLHAPQ